MATLRTMPIPPYLLGTPTSSARARFVNGWPYQTYWQNAWYAQLTILGLTYPSYVKQAFVSAGSLLPTISFSGDGIPVSMPAYDAQNKLLIPDGALVNGIDYNWRSQRVDQYSFNVEREIKKG